MNLLEKKYNVGRFLKIFVVAAIASMFLIGLTTYIVDPFLQFRVNPENKYILNPRFVNGGLAKNYNYNTAIIGSSMIQSFDVSTLRNNYTGLEPVKLSSGGMNLAEMELLYSIVCEKGTKNIILNIDMPFFNQAGVVSRYPKYLYEDGVMNKLKYLFGYEAVVQYLPADLGVSLYFKWKKDDISPIYVAKTSIDKIGTEDFAKTYNADFVKNSYLSGNSVLYQHTDGMEERMKNSLESFVSGLEIEKHKDVSYTFMFPSYSALYWYHTRKHNYYNQFLNFVSDFTKAVENYDNVRIISFLDRPEITDLNYYGDITHFSPALADSIMTNMFNPKYEINSSNIHAMRYRVDSLVDSYIAENKNWLPK
ncbi:hypothetical protein JGH11_16720 [Dysgonomonas sp. Marseille-P4677]|uniref:hypothetical protein n=1 Tax=Dysgonomonas sp. Marseille-P4677 TaxID=2364790 RepID=UPI001914D7CA|nr:hypothetical protein [Dysgonomonas sp. Marseille-P4677]MBK5722519.1 hypothetical protein [Dysgonomonas sp. Marseille-P4677]